MVPFFSGVFMSADVLSTTLAIDMRCLLCEVGSHLELHPQEKHVLIVVIVL